MEGRGASLLTPQGAVMVSKIATALWSKQQTARLRVLQAREAGVEDQEKLFAKLTLAAAMTLAATSRPTPLSHIAAQSMLATISDVKAV
jgi:hypothetical protein